MNTQEIIKYICQKGDIKDLSYLDSEIHPRVFGKYLTSNPNDVTLTINNKTYNFWMEGSRYVTLKVRYLDQEENLCNYRD